MTPGLGASSRVEQAVESPEVSQRQLCIPSSKPHASSKSSSGAACIFDGYNVQYCASGLAIHQRSKNEPMHVPKLCKGRAGLLNVGRLYVRPCFVYWQYCYLTLLSRRSRKNILALKVVAKAVTLLKPSLFKSQIEVATTQNAFQVRVCVAGRELEQSHQVQ